MKKDAIKDLLIVVLLIIIVCGGIVLYKQQEAEKTESSALPQSVSMVEVSVAKPQDVNVSQSFIGQVVAINSVNIVPYLSGYIAQIPVDSGATVKKDDVLIVLQQDEYKAQQDSAYAAVLTCVADLRNAQNQYERLLKAGKKAVSQTELENAQTEVLRTQGALKQAKANYETAAVNLGYTLIKAPFDGVLGNISVSVGDFISPAKTSSLVRIVKYNPARVVFSITDKEFLQRANIFADKVKLQLSDGQKYPFVGKIIYTENALDKNTNTLAVYAEFSNPQRLLIPNAYVKVFLEHVYKKVFLLPKNLLYMQNDGNYAYGVKDGKVALLKVEIIAEQGDNYLLENNLQKDEFILSEEIEPSLVGQKVKIAKSSEEK